jgi:hypothetical protein
MTHRNQTKELTTWFLKPTPSMQGFMRWALYYAKSALRVDPYFQVLALGYK